MSEERHAVDPLSPEEFQQVPEHLEDDGPAETALTAAKPGGPLRFARMVGASIAGRDAAAWVTDFLNAAYYRRPVPERDVDDVRLASCVLTTFWYRKERGGRRLRLTDLGAFHRAFGGHRFDTELSGRGLLTREQLLGGAAGLVGIGSRMPTPTTPGAVGGSRSRPRRSAPRMTRRPGCGWLAWAS